MILKNRSLRTHFLLLYVLLAVLSGIVVPALGAKFSLNAFRRYQNERRQDDLESLGESLTALHKEDGLWKHGRVKDILRPAPQWMGMKITLLDVNNKEIYTLQPIQPGRRGNLRNNFNAPPQISEQDLITKHITINLGKNKNIGRLEIEYHTPSGRFELSFVAYLTRYTLIGALIMILVACGLGFIVAGGLSRPVIKAIERTKKISHGEYNSQEIFKPSGIREMDALSRCVEDLGRSLASQEKLRQRLMIDIAHELRTPLTVTRTQIEAIADGIWEPTTERLELCVNEMQRLGNLIEDVESLARLEGEAVTVHPELTDMKKFLNIALDSFMPLFERSEIKLTRDLENVTCEIDRDRFRHVIDNLLSNAQRYTNSGGNVKVKLYKKDSSAIIEIIDTGIGIPEKDLPNIFERFYRADESRTRVTGGRGVGLAIAKAAVEAHGGSISVESKKNEGSCFKIILPA